MNQPLINHFYTETSNRLTGYVGTAYKRQGSQVKSHMAKVLKEHGPAELSAVMHNLVEFGQNYPGGQQNIYMGDVFSAIGEMRTANIEPGSHDYREQLAHMANGNLFSASELTVDVDAPSRAQQAGNSLQEALAHHKRELGRANGPYADENEVLRLERTIGKIESDIQRMNGSPVAPNSAPDKPVLSPEAQARQDAADQAYHDSVARAEAAERDGPQDDVQNQLIDDGDDFDAEEF